MKDGDIELLVEIAKFENNLKEKGIVLRRLSNVQDKREMAVLLKDPFPPLAFSQLPTAKAQSTIQPMKHDTQVQHQLFMKQLLHRQGQKLREI